MLHQLWYADLTEEEYSVVGGKRGYSQTEGGSLKHGTAKGVRNHEAKAKGGRPAPTLAERIRTTERVIRLNPHLYRWGDVRSSDALYRPDVFKTIEDIRVKGDSSHAGFSHSREGQCYHLPSKTHPVFIAYG